MASARPSENVTALLADAGQGDREAMDRLWPLIYDDLRRIAHRQLRRRGPGQTLRTTALVHEAYLKLVDQTQASWENRLHFFALAARVMRHILIDYARQRSRQKRGGHRPHLPFDEAVMVAEERAETFLALDEALMQLAALNERLARIVECRFFGGMTQEEIAQLLDVSVRTVRRDWRMAKAWLATALAEPSDPADPAEDDRPPPAPP